MLFIFCFYSYIIDIIVYLFVSLYRRKKLFTFTFPSSSKSALCFSFYSIAKIQTKHILQNTSFSLKNQIPLSPYKNNKRTRQNKTNKTNPTSCIPPLKIKK